MKTTSELETILSHAELNQTIQEIVSRFDFSVEDPATDAMGDWPGENLEVLAEQYSNYCSEQWAAAAKLLTVDDLGRGGQADRYLRNGVNESVVEEAIEEIMETSSWWDEFCWKMGDTNEN